MAHDPVELLSLRLPCDAHAPGEVRQALADIGDSWRLGDAILVASELVTNAVTHSACEADDQLEVRAILAPDPLLISVHDPGISKTPALARAQSAEPGGWGLHIVDQLARRWGAERPDGYRVWAELPV